MLEHVEMRAVAALVGGLLVVSSCGGNAVKETHGGQGGAPDAQLEGGRSGSAGVTAQGGRPGAGGSARGGDFGMGGRMTGIAGAAGTGGDRPVSDAGVSCSAVAPSPVCDYGLSCQSDSECVHGVCYVPGTGENPICARYCSSDLDCPEGSVCATSYPNKYCFIACDSEADCQGINDHPGNPVRCVTLEDAQVCAQESEP